VPSGCGHGRGEKYEAAIKTASVPRTSSSGFASLARHAARTRATLPNNRNPDLRGFHLIGAPRFELGTHERNLAWLNFADFG
jgi:hypothetical protein